MREKGLHEVTDPLVFLDNVNEAVAGKSIIGVTEGKRQLFYEIQTLAVPTSLSMPRRVVKGVDYNKVQLLLAVIKKHFIQLDSYDTIRQCHRGVRVTSTMRTRSLLPFIIHPNIPIPAKNRTLCRWVYWGVRDEMNS
jgi:DNA repair protein RadA/Sms